ncbi:MAG: prephenate dehydratase [Bacillota bacterium]|nr:prephenate dehydratase [Bacillota bacterium]
MTTNDRLGYLGPHGTLSEEAAERFASALGVPPDGLVAHVSVPAALDDVRAGNTRWAVVPAENSLEGSVGLTWDYLISTAELAIAGEAVLPVVHHLLGKRGLKLGSVIAVLSHQQALGQCRAFLQSRLPRAKQYETASTAEAARVVSVNELPLAAVGSERAARLYGLDILERNIQDVAENATRFLLVGRAAEPVEPTGCDRTSLVCALERDRPGALYQMLGVFAARGINLSRLESRPARKQLGEYVFLIDAEGHAAVEPLAGALAELKEQGSLLRIIGSYPAVLPSHRLHLKD